MRTDLGGRGPAGRRMMPAPLLGEDKPGQRTLVLLDDEEEEAIQRMLGLEGKDMGEEGKAV